MVLLFSSQHLLLLVWAPPQSVSHLSFSSLAVLCRPTCGMVLDPPVPCFSVKVSSELVV